MASGCVQPSQGPVNSAITVVHFIAILTNCNNEWVTIHKASVWDTRKKIVSMTGKFGEYYEPTWHFNLASQAWQLQQ